MAENCRVLLICDDEEMTRYLREHLIVNGGCLISVESTAQAGLNTLRQESFDIVIAKSGMADLETPELIKGIKKINPDAIIIVVLEQSDSTVMNNLSRLGVYDFVTRPLNLEKLLFLITKGTELSSLMVANRKLTQSLQEQNTALQKQNIILAKRIEESTKNLSKLYEDLRSTYMRTIKALAQAIDARDHYTHSHSENVARYAELIASQMGLSAKEIELIREACELHDLGKIGIQDSILSKPSSLTEEEWKQVKKHPVTAAHILEPLTFLNEVIEIVRQHHEHYDGSGYPEGRKGEDILLAARIIDLADAYEAMTTPRAYRKIPLTKEEAILEIKRNSGKQFDPKVVEAFLKVINKLR